MSDQYLIAHKVRGEPAFDIAIQMPCPECDNDAGCDECDGEGYWWIIPTSGHRAYPYWEYPLGQLYKKFGEVYDSIGVPPIPPTDLPDHYPVRQSPAEPKRNLLAELGLNKPKGHHPAIGQLKRRV